MKELISERENYRELYAQIWNEREVFFNSSFDCLLAPVGSSAAPQHGTAKWRNYTSLCNFSDYPAVVFLVTTVDFVKDQVEVDYKPRNALDNENYKLYISIESYSNVSIGLQVICRRFNDEKPRFHQLCSSDFIQKNWIDHISSVESRYISIEFGYTGRLIFLTLASFCRLSNEILMSSLEIFKSTRFITAQALIKTVFEEQIDAVIQDFETSTIDSYYELFNLNQFSTQTNTLLSGLFSNLQILINIYTGGFFTAPGMYEDFTCDCDTSTWCADPLPIDDRRTNQSDPLQPRFMIPASCIETIEQYLQAPLPLTRPILPLNSSIVSRFNVSSTVNQLLSKAMTEEWEKNVSHVQYFHQCQVSSCIYSFSAKFNIIYIATTLIGLVGGLIKILRILIPRIVKFIRRRFAPPPTVVNEPNMVRRSLMEYLRTFNYFSKPLSAPNETEIKQQIISTRLYCLLLAISFIVLITYYSMERVMTSHQIKSPTFEQFIQLQIEQYSNPSFSCPCSTLAIAHEKFIQIKYDLHPFCWSEFISKGWYFYDDINWYNENYYTYDFRILKRLFFASLYSFCGVSYDHIQLSLIAFNSSLFVANKALAPQIFVTEMDKFVGPLNNRDFRIVGDAIFQTIASFCQVSLAAINDGLLEFDQTSFITVQTIPEDQLVEQTQALIDLFISTSENEFISSLQIIRDTIHANVLLSGFETTMSTEFRIPDGWSNQIGIIPKTYNMTSSCSCYNDPTCIEPIGLYTLSPNNTLIYLIPGFFIGCYIVEATLKSNLASLYNQTWIDEFRARILYDYFNSIPFITKALNASYNSQFNLTTPIYIILQKMMIESWHTQINYSAYYEQCHPIECQYSYIVKSDVLYMVTTIIGLIGGLVTILQLVIPRAVKLIRRHAFNRRQHTAVQVIPIS
ncbi:unnamed protein product [Rotaria sordida]|uniref:Amidase domain-containing protein n=1 Tax=Rotaria sordida TaxID=392033 RepID=A0A819H5S0_9BILA|nr:unnamed protein product [Rotaria sordida]